MIRITVLPRAQRDLDDTFDYIAAHDPEAAERLIRDIEEALKPLTLFPQAGRSRPELGTDIRTWQVAGTYTIFYRPFGNELQIVRVLHSRRDVTLEDVLSHLP